MRIDDIIAEMWPIETVFLIRGYSLALVLEPCFCTDRKISLALRPAKIPLWIRYMMLISVDEKKFVEHEDNGEICFAFCFHLLTSRLPSRIIRHVSKICEYSRYRSASFKHSYTLHKPL